METKEKPSQETLKQWQDDPANWKWGVFYYNKEDKRLLPPKRVKYLGWTTNFANPYSVLTLLGIIILLVSAVRYFS